MALGTILSGRNGIVKVGGTESDNIEQWTWSSSKSSTDIAILNTTSDTSISGSKNISGTIDLWFDPADATHISMQTGGTGALELYLDGEAFGDYYFSGNVDFISFDVTGSAPDGTVKASVSWKATGAHTLPTVTTTPDP